MRKEQCLRFFSKTKRKFRKTIWGDIRKGYFVWRQEKISKE